MAKTVWRGGNMLYPVPAVMVSTADRDGRSNIITVAWAGTVCSNPPMVSISVMPRRFSHALLCDSREFVINLTSRKLQYACDWCGVRSGADVNKWQEMKLTPEPAATLNYAPLSQSLPSTLNAKLPRSRSWEVTICFWLRLPLCRLTILFSTLQENSIWRVQILQLFPW